MSDEMETNDDREGTGRAPTVGDASPAMRFAHILMVSTAIAFSFGYAVYLLLVTRVRVGGGGGVVGVYLGAIASCVVGVVLFRYLREFRRRSRASGSPPPQS